MKRIAKDFLFDVLKEMHVDIYNNNPDPDDRLAFYESLLLCKQVDTSGVPLESFAVIL